MAWEIYSFSATIPAGTAKSNPAIIDLTIPVRIVQQIEILVPPGPRGEVGFQIGASGVTVFPNVSNTFIITDDEVLHWEVDNTVESGAWQLIGFNNGTFSHTLYIRFYTVPTTIPALAQPRTQVIPSQNLGGQVS